MKFVLLTLLLICSSFSGAHAQQETHGGDGFATEFFQVYTDLRAQLPNEEIALPNGGMFSVTTLDHIRPKLNITTSPQVFWNGKEVSARNTPEKFLIELSQTHWVRLNYVQKLSLVLHEVLPIAGWVDGDYTLSTALLKHINLKAAELSLNTLAHGLLTCNTTTLQNLSLGLYRSFLPSLRANLLHLAIISECEYYLQNAVAFTSLAEVQTDCDPETGRTPFETLLSSASSSPARHSVRFMRLFDLIYPEPHDGRLYCKVNGALKAQGTVCEMLKKRRDQGLDIAKALSKKSGCK